MPQSRQYLVAGEWKTSDETIEVTSPFDGEVVATVSRPPEPDIEAAVQAASESFDLAIGAERAEARVDLVEVGEGVVQGVGPHLAPNVDPDNGAHALLDAPRAPGRVGRRDRHPMPAESSADWSDSM